jgi:nucleotide-binding universal stress UspA family protein
MKILCATDFTPRASVASNVALDLARLTSGSVEVLHVVPPRTTDMIALAADAAVLDGQVRSDAEARLTGQCRELAGTGVPVTSSVREGDVESTILARAKEMGADLIVMGANGRSALGRFALGSGADRTVRRADRPVLIVPAEVESLTREKNGTRQLQVVVALDGRAASDGALEFAGTLRRHAPCDVTFLRLYWPIEEYARLGLTGPRDFLTPDPEVTADLQRTLGLQVGVLPGSGRTTFAIEATWGDPARRIVEFAREHEANLLIMGAESRRGLGRAAHPAVADRVARLASGVPIVFVPPSPRAPAFSEVPGLFTVLAPTDLSAAGNRAVPFAYALLSGHGGVVELCHVHERALATPPYAYELAEGKLAASERTRIESELRALIPRDAERLGITTHVTIVDGGKASTAIRQAAERFAVDSIVLGSHGRSGTYRSLLGSVSEDVCDVPGVLCWSFRFRRRRHELDHESGCVRGKREDRYS